MTETTNLRTVLIVLLDNYEITVPISYKRYGLHLGFPVLVPLENQVCGNVNIASHP